MPLDFSDDVAGDFLVGQYAYWAGDYAFAQECFAKCAEREITKPDLKARNNPEDDSLFEDLRSGDSLLRFVSDKRELRMAAKIDQFEKMTIKQPEGSATISSQPLVLESKVLRGAVWQIDSREFLMRAYLTNIDEAGLLIRTASTLAKEQMAKLASTDPKVTKQKEFTFSTGVYEWVHSESPFVLIRVNDLLFIEVSAYWTKESLPKDFSTLRKSLQEVLDKLGGTARK